jgi:hypothetical protein
VSHRALSGNSYLVHLIGSRGEQRYSPSVSSVAGEMQVSMDDCNHRFIQADSVSAASQVMRAQARVNVEKQRARGRSTCRFIKLPTAGGQPTAPRHCSTRQKDVCPLSFAQHSTAVDCCFLDDAPLPLEQSRKTLDHTLVLLPIAAAFWRVEPRRHRATTATAFRARA